MKAPAKPAADGAEESPPSTAGGAETRTDETPRVAPLSGARDGVEHRGELPENRWPTAAPNPARNQGLGAPAEGKPGRVPCMAAGPLERDGCGTVCMRPDGHAGAHRWCRDDEVSVRLTPAGRAALYRSLQVQVEVDHGG